MALRRYRPGWPSCDPGVVDDNATSRLVIRSALAQIRVVTAEVGNGPDALAEMRRAYEAGVPYGVMLLDCRMRGMDGLEVIERCANDPALLAATVLMVTSDEPVRHWDRFTGLE